LNPPELNSRVSSFQYGNAMHRLHVSSDIQAIKININFVIYSLLILCKMFVFVVFFHTDTFGTQFVCSNVRK
jgi:hypothetical protein